MSSGTIDTVPAPGPEDVGIPLLDPDPARFGPVSRRLLLRFVAVLAVVQGIGASLVFVAGTPHAVAVGLSLALPGGGLLYTGHPVAFLACAALLVLALVLWWGVSAHVAIPLVWLGSAGVAWWLVDAPRLVLDRGTTWGWAIPAVYLLLLLLVGAAIAAFERQFREKRARVPELNEYLATVDLRQDPRPSRDPDASDAELLRWCLDLAFQPDDGLKGFDWGEQFHGGTQLRYQVNAFSWALSLYAANYVPNASTQVEAALIKVVLKHTDLRVWRYWRTLNLVGNLDPNPDPIVRDNIMFSAFLGDVLNMFEAATGSTHFDQPGSLTFVWEDGREFPYDHHSLIAAVRANFERSNLGFFPCEPGWSFTVCNIFGAQSLYGHDTLHGTDLWASYRDRWLAALDQEYLTPDGTYAHIRSNHVGLSWDTGEVEGGHYHANGTGRFSDILPGHGRRAKALDLRKAAPAMGMLSTLVVDGTLPLELPEELERHRTSSSALPSWTRVIGGARLVGDEALALAATRAAHAQCATGARWPEAPMSSSAAGLAGHLIVRWSSPMELPDLNRRGYVAPLGPVLADTAWDDVLVVLARSPDARSLDLALEPLAEAPLEAVHLRFTALVPGTGYSLRDDRGASVDLAVDGRGGGSVTVPLVGPTRFVLAPAGEVAR